MSEHSIKITDLNISSVNVDIAWLKFENEDTVRAIFTNSAKIQSNRLHMFPVTPNCANERKKAIESIFKQIQRTNTQFRYQIRLGEHDFHLFVKEYKVGEYEPYREISMEFIDPHEEQP